MTTKKATTKKKATRRPSVKERARRIVADVKGYDSDTRKSIRHMLDKDDKDLADFVERAEVGETVCDLTRIDGEQAEAAAALDALLSMPGLPLWMKEGVRMMLDHAGRKSHGALSDLFAVTALDRFEFTPKMDAADMLSRLIKDEELPESIRYRVGCAVTDLKNEVDTDAPDVIRVLLEKYKAENGGEGR